MSNKTVRHITRVIHLVWGFAMGALIYSPLYDAHWYLMLIRVAAVPIVVISGLVLWQQPRISKWRKQLQASLLGVNDA
ncbi:MAG: hypothetical protein AAF267_16160 [Deinococcota bacterium]